MTRALTKVQARRQGDDLPRYAKRERRDVEIRRVAVVRPGGEHFKLLPLRASLAAGG